MLNVIEMFWIWFKVKFGIVLWSYRKYRWVCQKQYSQRMTRYNGRWKITWRKLKKISFFNEHFKISNVVSPPPHSDTTWKLSMSRLLLTTFAPVKCSTVLWSRNQLCYYYRITIRLLQCLQIKCLSNHLNRWAFRLRGNAGINRCMSPIFKSIERITLASCMVSFNQSTWCNERKQLYELVFKSKIILLFNTNKKSTLDI